MAYYWTDTNRRRWFASIEWLNMLQRQCSIEQMSNIMSQKMDIKWNIKTSKILFSFSVFLIKCLRLWQGLITNFVTYFLLTMLHSFIKISICKYSRVSSFYYCIKITLLMHTLSAIHLQFYMGLNCI